MTEISRSIGFLLARGPVPSTRISSTPTTSPPAVRLLRFLCEEDSITQVELSSRSQIDRTTIGGLIDRLEQSGLLQRPTPTIAAPTVSA